MSRIQSWLFVRTTVLSFGLKDTFLVAKCPYCWPVECSEQR